MFDELFSRILGRDKSLFEEDIEKYQSELRDIISQTRILVIGAAGSIGSAFVKQVLQYHPTSLHLVDLNENNLVELVRDLRSSSLNIPKNFKTMAIGLGNWEFKIFLQNEFRYDHVVNFSALKHIRSERDPYTLIRMLNTNVYYVKELLEFLSNHQLKNFFSVSSDKSVNPASIMGASKALMEKVMFFYSEQVPVSTSRFANVAFSDGSLLYGFYLRLRKKQPISAPSDIKRYFISSREAGQLCLISCFLGNNRDILFPKRNHNLELISLTDLAKKFLEAHGFQAEQFPSEQKAKKAAELLEGNSKVWPCYFAQSDTSGEKLFEEFYTKNDVVDMGKYQKIGVIHGNPLIESEREGLIAFLHGMKEIKKLKSWSKENILQLMKMALPEFQHRETGKNLDQKM